MRSGLSPAALLILLAGTAAAAVEGDAHRNTFGVDLPWSRGTLEWDGRTFPDVGVRFKGNYTFLATAGGLHRSLKIDLDRHVKKRLDGLSILHPHAGDNPLLDRILAIPVHRDRYLAIIAELSGGRFTETWFLDAIAGMEAVLREPLALEAFATLQRGERRGGRFGDALPPARFARERPAPSPRSWPARRRASCPGPSRRDSADRPRPATDRAPRAVGCRLPAAGDASMTTRLSRRRLLRAAAATPALFTISDGRRRVLGANERLDVAVIGVGGRGAGNLDAVAGENVVALCDVDAGALAAAAGRHPDAARFVDYRTLLERAKLDAVVIATPDHHHAPPTVRALARGLHVYCEKPLTHTVAEARKVAALAAEQRVATQMGTQNHEHPGYLRLVELLRCGAIGAVSDVHVITDRPGTWWPQGMAAPAGGMPVPQHLDWNLWLGPAADRAYDPAYVPFRWRGWWDFGCGAVGDMAIHLADPAFWGLDLAGPVRVESRGPAPNPVSAPEWMETTFAFGPRGDRGPVTLHWYEGTAQPSADVAAELPMNGSLFVGSKGRIAIAHDGFPKLLPEETFAGFVPPAPSLPESPGHHRQWIDACKTGARTGSPFSYAAPFTETVLLGNVAYRAGCAIEFDPATGRITNAADAMRFLSKEYRPGWEV